MGLSASLNPTKAEGCVKLETMEIVDSIGRPFTMEEALALGADPKVIRYAWDNSILTIVGYTPLRYEITHYGRQLMERAQKERERQLRKQEQETERVAA